MKYDKLIALSSGTCIKIDNSLKTNVDSIEFELESNKNYEDHIRIFNARELVLDGTIYSDNNRVSIKNNVINDRSVDIDININTIDLIDGDEISGTLSIITNFGIKNIPFIYRIKEKNIICAIRKLMTVEDFYNIVISNFNDGINIFFSSFFTEAPFMQTLFNYSLYDGLIKGTEKRVALREFLFAFNLDATEYISFDNDNENDVISNKNELDNASVDNNFIDNNSDNYNIDEKKIELYKKIKEDEKNEEAIKEAIEVVNSIKDKELLMVLALNCIRNNYVDKIAFYIYLHVIEKGSNISGIYDKFLMSIPENYSMPLPIYIYRFYFEDKSYSFDDKLNLYENIISTFNENDEIYKFYESEIKEYALSKINQNKITTSLVGIYKKILTEEVVNENNYNNILYLIRTHKIIIKNSNIKKVIIKYIETDRETKYDVINGIAYIPIFFESYMFIYEDKFSNRYYKEDIEIEALFNMQNLEMYIIDRFEEKQIVEMTKIIKLEEQNEFDTELMIDEIEEIEKKVELNEVLKKQFIIKTINFYYKSAINGEKITSDGITNLKKINFTNLSNDSKKMALKTLLYLGEYNFVYNKISLYGMELLENNDLVELLIKIIESNDIIDRQKLLNDLIAFSKTHMKIPQIISFLSDNYEGSIENMIFILDTMSSLNIDTDIFAKKIMMICLETGESKDIDHIYKYINKNLDDNKNLMVAYLNKKATDYFLDDAKTDNDYFNELINYMLVNFDDIDNMPIIFLFAITKYISTLNVLNNNNLRRILIKSMERLLQLDLVFAYYKKINKHMKMPYSIMNKEYIEYHTKNDFVPKAILTISGIDEKKELELSKVFMNIYIKKVTVFKNETIQYEIINSMNPTLGVLDRGELKYDENYELEYPKSGRVKTTFDYINDAIVCIDRENIEGLKKVIREMTEKQEISKNLFNI